MYVLMQEVPVACSWAGPTSYRSAFPMAFVGKRFCGVDQGAKVILMRIRYQKSDTQYPL
jgi:hypothetical protein